MKINITIIDDKICPTCGAMFSKGTTPGCRDPEGCLRGRKENLTGDTGTEAAFDYDGEYEDEDEYLEELNFEE